LKRVPKHALTIGNSTSLKRNPKPLISFIFSYQTKKKKKTMGLWQTRAVKFKIFWFKKPWGLLISSNQTSIAKGKI